MRPGRVLPSSFFFTILTALLVLPPVLWVLGAAAAGAFGAMRGGLFPDALAAQRFGRSLLLAAEVTAMTAGIGLVFGWLLARARLPGRGALALLSVAPLLIPPYASAAAWYYLLGRAGFINNQLPGGRLLDQPVFVPGSLGSAIWVLGWYLWPVVAWFVLTAARSVPAELEDAARLDTGPMHAALVSGWSYVRPGLLAGGLLCFLLAFVDFGVPDAMSVFVYANEIYMRFQAERSLAMAARMTLPLALVVVPLMALELRWLAAAPLAPDPGTAARPVAAGWVRWPGLAFCLLVLTISVFGPLGMLVYHSESWQWYARVWEDSQEAFGTSVLLAVATGAVCGVLALGGGNVSPRWRSRDVKPGPRLGTAAGGVWTLLVSLPVSLPGSLLAIGLIALVNRPGPIYTVYGTPLLLVWCYVAQFFAFARHGVSPGWQRVDHALLDDSALLGASGWNRFRVVVWPAVRPYALLSAALVMALTLREMDATLLLKPPGLYTVAFWIGDYLHFGTGQQVSALCILLVALTLGALGLLASVFGGEER